MFAGENINTIKLPHGYDCLSPGFAHPSGGLGETGIPIRTVAVALHVCEPFPNFRLSGHLSLIHISQKKCPGQPGRNIHSLYIPIWMRYIYVVSSTLNVRIFKNHSRSHIAGLPSLNVSKSLCLFCDSSSTKMANFHTATRHRHGHASEKHTCLWKSDDWVQRKQSEC